MEVIGLIKEKYPEYDESSYKNSFMKIIEKEISSGKTEAKKLLFAKEIQDFDLKELSQGPRSSIRDIKNMINENYTHNSLLNEIKKVKSEQFLETSENIKSLEEEIYNLKPDTAIDNMKKLNESSFTESMIQINVEDSIDSIIKNNPGLNKQEIIEKLISENPNYKDKILLIVNKSMNDQINRVKDKLSDKDIGKFDKQLEKEDLKELQELGEIKSIDQIKTLGSINNFHNDFKQELKRKASQMSVNNPTYPNQMNNIYQEPSINNQESSSDKQFSSNHLEDTMNLFD
jgi:hypothetical protein